MKKAFDYEDRLLVNIATGEVTMKIFYMHPGRQVDIGGGQKVFQHCGCMFASALWKEYNTCAGKT